MKIIYIVGRAKATETVTEWDFQGAFSTEDKAVAACRDETYFIGPAALDEELPHETMGEWPGAYYPKQIG